MATYNQYQSNVGSSYYNYFLSQVPSGMDYIIFSTQTEYMCVYGDFENGKFTDSTVLSIARTQSNGNVNVSHETSTTVNTTYDYYVYSNIGKGTYLVSPKDTNNTYQIQHFTFFSILIILFIILGFSVIKKRWI